MNPVLFHLAFPVTDIPQAKAFYADGLGCEVGRESAASIIFNLYGHQIVAHATPQRLPLQQGIYPRHFGLIFNSEPEWEAALENARTKQLTFYQESRIRFIGELTEHRTFFLKDPFGNLLEFKYYCHAEAIFCCRELTRIGDTDKR